jgi:hypothetical protein
VRVLAATTAGAGHFAGVLPFARACVRAGHEVRFAAPASFAGTVEEAGFVHQPLDDADPAALGAVFGRIPTLSMREADDLVVTEVFGRLDRDAALPSMRAAVDEWRPDVVLREPGELASYVAATERGIPHVQTNIGLSVLDDRFLPLLVPTLEEIGCPSTGLLSAPRWTTVPPSFDLPAETSTGAVTHAREPRPDRAGEPSLPDWWSGDDRPLAYVTFGSVAAGIGLFPSFYSRVLDPARRRPGSRPADARAGGRSRRPRTRAAQRARRALVAAARRAVPCRGRGRPRGLRDDAGGARAGVPQVVLPLFSFDQFVNADRVAVVGVGVALVDETADEPRAGDLVPHGPAATDRLADALRTCSSSARTAAGRASWLRRSTACRTSTRACRRSASSAADRPVSRSGRDRGAEEVA